MLQVFCRILEQSHTQIRSLKQIIDADALIPAYGAKADEICNLAVEAFTADAPLPDDSPDNEAVYDRKVEELEKALDAPLQVLYMKQLVLLKEKCLKLFKASSGQPPSPIPPSLPPSSASCCCPCTSAPLSLC